MPFKRGARQLERLGHHVAGGKRLFFDVLHAVDLLDETRHERSRHRRARRPGVVLDEHWQMRRDSDDPEILQQLVSARLSGVRRHGHDGVGSDLARVLGEHLGQARRRGGHADDDGHAMIDGLDHDARDAQALLFRQQGRFAGVDGRDDAVGACVDTELDAVAQRVFVDVATVVERRHGNGEDAAHLSGISRHGSGAGEATEPLSGSSNERSGAACVRLTRILHGAAVGPHCRRSRCGELCPNRSGRIRCIVRL